MNKYTNGFSFYASICFAIAAMYELYLFLFGLKYGFYFSTLMFFIAEMGLAVSLFLRKKIPLMASAGLISVLQVVGLISSATGEYAHFSLPAFLALLSYVSLAATVFLSLKERSVVSKLWFISGSVYFVELLYSFVSSFSNNSFKARALVWFVEVIFALGLIFTGLWIKGEYNLLNCANTKNEPHTNIATVPGKRDILGNADKIKEYKALLDAGIITQEEYETKKKQLLG